MSYYFKGTQVLKPNDYIRVKWKNESGNCSIYDDTKKHWVNHPATVQTIDEDEWLIFEVNKRKCSLSVHKIKLSEYFGQINFNVHIGDITRSNAYTSISANSLPNDIFNAPEVDAPVVSNKDKALEKDSQRNFVFFKEDKGSDKQQDNILTTATGIYVESDKQEVEQEVNKLTAAIQF